MQGGKEDKLLKSFSNRFIFNAKRDKKGQFAEKMTFSQQIKCYKIIF